MTITEEPPDPDDAKHGGGGFRPVYVLIGLATLAAAIAAIAAIFLYFQHADAPPDNLWAEGSYVAGPDCVPESAECAILLPPIPAGHGSDGSGPAISLVTYPGLDDPIAQWGRCMDTVFTCLGAPDDASASERASRLRSCVAQAECPQACLDRYAGQAGGDLDAAVTAFERIFVAEDAWCAPRQD